MPPEIQENLVARRHEPPAALPTKDNTPVEEISLFGRTNFSSGYVVKRQIFGLKRQDRMRHLYVIGKSGVGKTKLLEQLIRADAFFGHGVCVIDPHGDLVQNILDFIPEHRLEDVMIINPGDREFPIAFNPIANVTEDDRFPVTNELIEIFKKQFGSDWNPRIEHLLRFTTLAMIDFPGGTINGMVSLLSSGRFRSRVIEHVKDSVVRRFWAIEFPEWSQRYDAEAVSPLLNKLGQLLADPLMRRIFGQQQNRVDFFDLMQQRRIVLVNLAKGLLGDDVSSFFGALVITKLKQSAMKRVTLPPHLRLPFYLYVDEFQNIATKTFENLLAEARKFGIAITVANQNLSQLDYSLKASLFGNVGSIITFQVGADDAKILQDELAPIFEFRDIINLGEREIYVKMTIEGKRYDPFSAEVLAVNDSKHPSYFEQILHRSRERCAMPRASVEAALAQEEQESNGFPSAPVSQDEIIV
ncbi:MAG TPA: type IV secretion system DNA-binding domain-containing protein [Patescibacteria group bacterium]|nr:type IV secretion system DNA-binding domain-containing protein [Patescibacteria group bacterium]